MSLNIHTVKQFLEKHDYIAKVNKSNDGCTLLLPEPKLIKRNFSPIQVNYKIIPHAADKETDIYVNNDVYHVPEYTARLLVTCDIFHRMRTIPINDHLISYYNEGQEVPELMDLLAAPADPEEAKKEGFLAGILSRAVEDKFAPMYEEVAFTSEHNVGIGYRILKGFF